MSNTIPYKNTYCPFRWVEDQLQVFYKKEWVNINKDAIFYGKDFIKDGKQKKGRKYDIQ